MVGHKLNRSTFDGNACTKPGELTVVYFIVFMYSFILWRSSWSTANFKYKKRRRQRGEVKVMMFNATLNNISAISWRSDWFVEETGENHWPGASHWQCCIEKRNTRDSNSQLRWKTKAGRTTILSCYWE